MFLKNDKVVLESGGQVYKVHHSDNTYTWVVAVDMPLYGDSWIPKRFLTNQLVKI